MRSSGRPLTPLQRRGTVGSGADSSFIDVPPSWRLQESAPYHADSTPVRLLIVSNRLPIATTVDGEHISFTHTAGGLATGLRGFHQRTGGLWIGWPGTSGELAPEAAATLSARLAESGIVPVFLTDAELRD